MLVSLALCIRPSAMSLSIIAAFPVWWLAAGCVPDRDGLPAPGLDPSLVSKARLVSLTFTARHSVDVMKVVGILDGCVVVGGATMDSCEAGLAERADPCCKNYGLAKTFA